MSTKSELYTKLYKAIKDRYPDSFFPDWTKKAKQRWDPIKHLPAQELKCAVDSAIQILRANSLNRKGKLMRSEFVADDQPE